MSTASRAVVIIDGVRSPFLRSHTGYKRMEVHELFGQCLSGLLASSKVDPKSIDCVIGGTGLDNTRNHNFARQAILGCSDMPTSVQGITVSNACLSGFSAAGFAVDAIKSGRISAAILGAAEIPSTYPVRYKKPIERLIRSSMQKHSGKSEAQLADIVKNIGLKDFMPDDPNTILYENTTGYLPGYHVEMANKKWNISR